MKEEKPNHMENKVFKQEKKNRRNYTNCLSHNYNSYFNISSSNRKNFY